MLWRCFCWNYIFRNNYKKQKKKTSKNPLFRKQCVGILDTLHLTFPGQCNISSYHPSLFTFLLAFFFGYTFWQICSVAASLKNWWLMQLGRLYAAQSFLPASKDLEMAYLLHGVRTLVLCAALQHRRYTMLTHYHIITLTTNLIKCMSAQRLQNILLIILLNNNIKAFKL